MSVVKMGYAVHSEKDGLPSFRAWSRTQAGAQKKLEALKASDEVPDDEYWIFEMPEAEAQMYGAVGAEEGE